MEFYPLTFPPVYTDQSWVAKFCLDQFLVPATFALIVPHAIFVLIPLVWVIFDPLGHTSIRLRLKSQAGLNIWDALYRPALLMHRPTLLMYRLALLMHRPTLLMHRPALLMHRLALLMHRPTLLMHRPALLM